MNKIIALALMLIGVCALQSCSDENSVIGYEDPTDFFMPSPDATDKLSEIRKQFKEEEGSYLLFNDTLQHYYKGTDINGDKQYFTELLDVKYSVGGNLISSDKYYYTYLNEDMCVKATDYLKKFILPHCSTRLRPFSWFLCGTISGKNTSGNIVRPYTLTGERTIVLACGQLSSLNTDAKKQQLASRHLLTVIGNLASNNASAFSDFTEICSKYYKTSLTKPENVSANEYVRSYGFANSTQTITFPSQEDDISSFASMVITYTDEQIERIYANYPIVIQRAKLFKADLISLGYTF